MPQLIDVPGMGRVEFPDGMSDEQIIAAIRRNVGPAEPPIKTDDPGALGAMAIAGGRTLDRMAKGLEQGVMNVGSFFGSDAAKQRLTEMAAQEAENTRHFKKLEQERPVSTFIGGTVPLLPFGAIGTGIKSIAAASALPSLIEYGTPQEKLTGAAIGAGAGAAGAKLGQTISKAIQPAHLNQSQQKAIDAADRLGVNLTAGEASGNRAMRWAESASADLPFAAGKAQARVVANDKAISQAAARSIGQSADEVTEGVLSQARADIGATYDRILGNANIPLDSSFRAEVQSIGGSKVMKELKDESVEALLKPFRNMPNGVSVSGEWFQQNKTALDNAIRSAYNNRQPGKAKALEQFEEALDRAAMRSLSSADREAYKQAQRQWASLRLLETGKVIDGGRVMPGRLDSALSSRYKAAYKEGKIKGELADIAALSKSLQGMPQSGTAPRSFYGALGLGVGMAEPLTGASMLALPYLMQSAATNPLLKRYMTNGIMNVSPEMDALMMRGGGLLGLAPATY